MNPLFDEALSEVLSGRKYDRLTGRALDFKKIVGDLVARAVEFILRRLNLRMPDWNDYNTSLYLFIFTAVAAVITLAAAGAVVYIILRRRSKKNAPRDLSDVFDEIKQKNLSSGEYVSLSDDFASENKYREAVRYRFIAALLSLDSARVIKISKSKTNALLAKEVSAAAPGLSKAFNEAADQYHFAWFGYKKMDAVRFENFVSSSRILLQ